MSVPQRATPGGVSIVTQTRVRAGKEEEFASWQQGIGAAIAAFPGFIEQTVMPPNPPAQIDWVILQRFESLETATSWLNSKERLAVARRTGRYPYAEGQRARRFAGAGLCRHRAGRKTSATLSSAKKSTKRRSICIPPRKTHKGRRANASNGVGTRPSRMASA
jgi:heme-degrading monooxygenase HmoA